VKGVELIMTTVLVEWIMFAMPDGTGPAVRRCMYDEYKHVPRFLYLFNNVYVLVLY
jgi:hypothetical protein